MDVGDESAQAESVDTEHEESPASELSGPDVDGARLIALNMALNGESREDTERYLAEHFQLPDRLRLIDEVFRERGELPIANPDFSVAGLNPAFTQASAPPPQPTDEALDARRDARIRELERLLAQASEQIERGAAALERSRRRR